MATRFGRARRMMPHHAVHWVDGRAIVRTRRNASVRDIYHTLMETGWTGFIAFAVACYTVCNLVFAIIYALLPDAVAGMRPGSLADGFFFSCATLSTVGYGNMAPRSFAGNMVAALEMSIGLGLSALLTGLVFARFSRPREMFLCSRIAVVAADDEAAEIAVRVVPLRNHPIIDVDARLFLMESVTAADGRTSRRLVDLPLVEAHAALMPLCWTLVHRPKDPERFAAALADDALEIVLHLHGSYPLLATDATGGRTYRGADLRRDCAFVDILTEQGTTVVLDDSGIDATRPA